MNDLGSLHTINPRDVWKHEATDFTPWLAEHLGDLGQVLGMELELEKREADVGDFSLDLLAKDLGSGRTVVIENQLEQTDHDHLGKLLTYAAGFQASAIVWVAQVIREEHRQALDWLNQRTDTNTEFYGVIVEVLQIDQSRPACRFRPVVLPNTWQKTKLSERKAATPRAEAYRAYFQALIDELRTKHKFTGARLGQPQSWYAFSSGLSGVTFNAVFAGSGTVRVELYIDVGDQTENKALFNRLLAERAAIENACGCPLLWERMDERQASRVTVSRNGSITDAPGEIAVIRRWHVENLLVFKRAFAPFLR